MSAGGVILRPGERRAVTYTQTGTMDAGDGHIVFAAEGSTVIVMSDGGDIVLGHDDQDLFARHLFRAMHAAETISAAEVPY